MKMLRGIAVWLCAPLLASFLCTLSWSVILGGRMAMREAITVGIASLAFTLVGSAVLSGLFAGMGARPVRQRYILLVGLGGLIGGATMLLLEGWPTIVWAGAVYGLATACFWVGLHAVTHPAESRSS
jgi:hypothetical protein